MGPYGQSGATCIHFRTSLPAVADTGVAEQREPGEERVPLAQAAHQPVAQAVGLHGGVEGLLREGAVRGNLHR